jgi:hypothetical protein
MNIKPMSKPRLILHIGLNKTGTSSIQHSLMVNEPRLRDAGFHLPDRLGRADGGHHLLVALLRDKGPEAFVAEVRKRNAFPKTVISAESFLQILRIPAKARALSEALSVYFETELVLFLRRQDYLKESVFAQVAKHHFQGSILQHTNFLYNFVPYVDNLEKAFGQPNIKLVIYRDDRNFDAWTAFCGTLGISPIDYPVSTGHTNSSLPRRQTLALSMMPKPSRRVADFVIDVISNSDCVRDDGMRWLMSPDERRQFLKRYLPWNRKICSRYALEGADFFCSDEMPAADWFPPEPISGQEWADFAAALASRIVRPAQRSHSG